MKSNSLTTNTLGKWAVLFVALLIVPQFALANNQIPKKTPPSPPAKAAPAKPSPAPAKPQPQAKPPVLAPAKPNPAPQGPISKSPLQTKQPQPKEPQTKQPQTKEPQTNEPQTKQPQTKQPQTKEPQTKQPQTKEPQTKQPQAKESQTKQPQDKQIQKQHPSGIKAPAGSTRTADGHGGATYKSKDGTEYHARPDGNIDSVTTKTGTHANFNSRNGGVATIQSKGMKIQNGPNGARRIESTRASDGAKVVSDGHGNGYVEHNFTRGGQTFTSRSYAVNGRNYTAVYARYSYHGADYYNYVHPYYYGAAFYGWAYNPWAAPVYWGWGWGAAGWYGYYGPYFGFAPYYNSPDLWLTDYLLAADLQAAYAGQVGVPGNGGGPAVTVPGNQAWTDSGKYFNAGDQVTIAANGAVSMGAGWAPFPPAGKGPNCGSLGGFPDGELPCWSLIARIGDGPIFYVGNGTKLQASNSGELLLGVNDNILGDNSGNWFATVTGPSDDSGQAIPPPNSDAALSPEVKELVAKEVQDQIAASQQAATAAGSGNSTAPSDDQIPAALDPKHSVFIVSSTLSEQTDDGQACSLTGGDILTRITNTPDPKQNVRVMVATGKEGDCTTGAQFSMSIQDLQDMYNDFQAKTDDGLKKLAGNQGKNGIPTGPAAGLRKNPDGQAESDPNVAVALQQQNAAANQVEGEVDQATNSGQ